MHLKHAIDKRKKNGLICLAANTTFFYEKSSAAEIFLILACNNMS